MKNFIRAYTYTLVPTAIVVILGFVLFYLTQFSLSKSASLGTLHGFVVTLVLNIIPAFILIDKNKKNIKTKTKTRNNDIIKKQKNLQKTDIRQNKKEPNTKYSLYLLLDSQKAFDLSINAIIKQSLGTILNHDKHRGFLSVRAAYQTIDFEVKPLTRHTAKVDIKAQKDNETLHSILSYIKNKELSFLNY